VEQVPLAQCIFLFNYYVIFFFIYYVFSIFRFYVSFQILNRIKLYCFLKFVVYKLNSEIFKSKIVVLTKREMTVVTDIDVFVS
jgi:hypothetical protein